MSSKPQLPELKRYMEKRLAVKLNAGRQVRLVPFSHSEHSKPAAWLQVTGTLRGFDHFMNLVLDDAVEDVSPTEKRPIGKIVRRITDEVVVSRGHPPPLLPALAVGAGHSWK